jgi:hypothetical protein
MQYLFALFSQQSLKKSMIPLDKVGKQTMMWAKVVGSGWQ